MYPIPVLFVFYKRKDLALQTFAQIAKIKPAKLYLFSDFSDDSKIQLKVEDLRQEIISKINWPAKIYTNFRKRHIGIKYFEYTALNWVLKEHGEKYSIYIEDDIFCSTDFFRFQKEMLPRYVNDNRILGIAGYNFGYKPQSKESYFLSRFGWNWGIGFYNRLLDYYDPDLQDYSRIKYLDTYKSNFLNNKIYYALDTQLSAIANNKLQAPDPQIYYSAFRYNKYFIVSSKKLVENLGFNQQGHNAFLVTDRSRIEKLDKLV